jgi:putative SOS response-associated peptidase YedK
MCGRYTLRRTDLARAALSAEFLPGFEEFTERPHYNIAPSQDVAVVRLNRQGGRVLGLVRWGLIPHWAKQKPKSRPINARAETVATSSLFRTAFARRRCLVPADGFYEWQTLDTGARQPMLIRFPDDRLFCFAGVWERWRPSPDTEPIDTCAILTTTANQTMRPIHDRMPVILDPADYDRWLDSQTSLEEAAALAKPYPDGTLATTPVDPIVNSTRNDVPTCVRSLA